MVWLYLRPTLNRSLMATTAWTASRRDGGDGCQGDDVERRWDDWHRLHDHHFCSQAANFFPLPFSFCYLSIDQLDKADVSLIPDEYIYPLACNVSSHSESPTTWWVCLPFLRPTPSRSKATREFDRACACIGRTRPYHASRNRASPSPATSCTHDAETQACPRFLLPSPYSLTCHEPLRLRLW
jgi:hypothetical protein